MYSIKQKCSISFTYFFYCDYWKLVVAQVAYICGSNITHPDTQDGAKTNPYILQTTRMYLRWLSG